LMEATLVFYFNMCFLRSEKRPITIKNNNS
jgi:hypothetical protein